VKDKQYYVYILTTNKNTVLYAGVTNDLLRRVYEHKNNLVDGFTRRYNVHKLVYYEVGGDIVATIEREKQIKGWGRQKKIEAITAFNPEWRDLYEELVPE
jgi:putative endonuclease